MKVLSVLFLIMFSGRLLAQDMFQVEALEAEATSVETVAWHNNIALTALAAGEQLTSIAMMGGGDGGGGGISVLTPEMIKHLYPNLGWAKLPAWQRNAIKVSDGKLFIDLAKEQVEDVLLVNSDVILMEEVKAQSPRGILALPVEKVDNIMTVAGDIVDYRSAASF